MRLSRKQKKAGASKREARARRTKVEKRRRANLVGADGYSRGGGFLDILEFAVVDPHIMLVVVFGDNLEFEKTIQVRGFSEYMGVVNQYCNKGYKDQLADRVSSLNGVDSLFIPIGCDDLTSIQLREAVKVFKK